MNQIQKQVRLLLVKEFINLLGLEVGKIVSILGCKIEQVKADMLSLNQVHSDYIIDFIAGVIFTLNELNQPAVKSEAEPYYQLLLAIFGEVGELEADTPEFTWKQYIQKIADKEIPLPKSLDAMKESLAKEIIGNCRHQIKPIWPADAPAIIEEQINRLPENLQEVIRLRFGINCQNLIFDQVAQKRGVSSSRIQQMQAKALRMLRHPRYAKKMEILFWTVQRSYEQNFQIKKECKSLQDAITDLQSRIGQYETVYGRDMGAPDVIQSLLSRVEDLEVSVRTANCLSLTEAVYLKDLVVKTENDMLRIRNFGRHSLNELKEVLKDKGLYLGMIFPVWLSEKLNKQLTPGQ